MKNSLNPDDKLRLRAEFEYVREHGVKQVGFPMLLVSALSPDGKLRCGVICGKKYSIRAVKRNRARRLLWESFRILKARIEVCHLILIARQGIAPLKRQEVQAQMERLLRQAGRLKS